jgi:oxygen-independent coproporphyrinogen-3 oxidase
MLLYIHFPFCSGKCAYCAFYSRPWDEGLVQRYLQDVTAEMAHWSRALGRPRLETVYFGGGTPSLLAPSDLERVLAGVDEHFRWDRSVECTLEANPGSGLDRAYLRSLRKLGVNRLSLGVQSLDEAQLRLLGRRHTAGDALRCVGEARRAGFDNVNLDLIWGLPGQTPEQWLAQLERIADLEPEHLSCYGLGVEPGTGLAERAERGELRFPDEEEEREMYLRGAELLEAKGFRHYEISNFAQAGRKCRHNAGYWQGVDYLGLGPSGVSTLRGRRIEHPAGVEPYGEAVRSGRLWERGSNLTREERIRERIMLRLRTSRGIGLEELGALTGLDLRERLPERIEWLRETGIVSLRSGFLRLTAQGWLVSDSVIPLFFPGQDAEEQARA